VLFGQDRVFPAELVDLLVERLDLFGESLDLVAEQLVLLLLFGQPVPQQRGFSAVVFFERLADFCLSEAYRGTPDTPSRARRTPRSSLRRASRSRPLNSL